MPCGAISCWTKPTAKRSEEIEREVVIDGPSSCDGRLAEIAIEREFDLPGAVDEVKGLFWFVADG